MTFGWVRSGAVSLTEYSSGMSIPVREQPTSWPTLAQDKKRERLLTAAAEIFARDGLGASMPAVAERPQARCGKRLSPVRLEA